MNKGFSLDREWLSILTATDPLFPIGREKAILPDPNAFEIPENILAKVKEIDLRIKPFSKETNQKKEFCNLLGLSDKIIKDNQTITTEKSDLNPEEIILSSNPNEEEINLL